MSMSRNPNGPSAAPSSRNAPTSGIPMRSMIPDSSDATMMTMPISATVATNFSTSSPSALSRGFEDRDPFVWLCAGHQLGDRVERKVVRRLEADAGLSHVELLPLLLERVTQLFSLRLVAGHAHHVDGVVVLLRGEREIRQGLLVVSRRIAREGNFVADHPPVDRLIVAVGQVVADDLPNR